jgi:hypothetical protein
VKLAEAHSIHGFRAPDLASLGAALDAAFASGGPALVDVAIDPDEAVLPIAPPGKVISDQILVTGAVERLSRLASGSSRDLPLVDLHRAGGRDQGEDPPVEEALAVDSILGDAFPGDF